MILYFYLNQRRNVAFRYSLIKMLNCIYTAKMVSVNVKATTQTKLE